MAHRRKMLKQLGRHFAGIGLARFSLSAARHPPNANLKDGLLSSKNAALTFKTNTMKLGAFSVSLNVKDLTASKEFYEALGFSVFAGEMQKNYLIMKNGNALIGLFHGMFKETILTFNPGWDENAKKMESYDDVRAIQNQLKDKGIKLMSEAKENTNGPARVMLTDPDGNQILLDQHV